MNILMAKIPKKKSQLKLYTLEQVFKKRDKEFERGYAAESARIALAKKIRETRTSKRLTQHAVAERANMPQSVIARIESGEHSVSVDTLARVAHALGKKIVIT